MAETPPRAGRAHVLVVDDNEDMRQSIADLLRTRGYHVAVATDAADARRLLARHDLALLVLDLGLERAGLNLLDRVERPPPVILISGSREDVPADARVSAFLAKPFRPERLLDEVARCAEPTG